MIKSERFRRSTCILSAVFLLASTLIFLKFHMMSPDKIPEKQIRLEPSGFVYRPDGGQRACASPLLKANALSRLNLGKRIILSEIDPILLGKFPGLGVASATKAIKRGCLNWREGRQVAGLINGGLCKRNSN